MSWIKPLKITGIEIVSFLKHGPCIFFTLMEQFRSTNCQGVVTILGFTLVC
jgi:hypothetical protein